MNIFISATNTNIGKTYTTLKLIEQFSKMGYKVGVFKPIETGVIDTPIDGELLLKEVQKYNPLFKNISTKEIVPIQLKLPAAPIVAGEVNFEKINQSYNRLKKLCDILLIEGAGGIKVPITPTFCMHDFIDYFNAKSLLVVQSKLGCINDLELNLSFFNPSLWIINLFDDDFYQISYPYLKQKYNQIFILQKNIEQIANKLIGEKL